MLDRIIVRGKKKEKFSIEFSMRWCDEALIVEISSIEPPRGHFESVRIDFSDFYCQWVYMLPEKRCWHEGMTGSVIVRFSESGYKLRLTFPWELSKGLSLDQEIIPMLLTACRMGPGQDTDIVTSMIMPLKVVPSY